MNKNIFPELLQKLIEGPTPPLLVYICLFWHGGPVLLSLMIFSLTGLAQFDSDGGLGERADQLSAMPQYSLYNSKRWADKFPTEYQNCRRQYDAFFADKILRINLALGYHDWPKTNQTLDQQSYGWIQKALTRDCPSERSTLCGFQQIESPFVSKLVFIKSIGSYSEDLTQDLRIRIELAYSSYSSLDSENFLHGKISPEQIETSRIAENLFFGGISGQNTNGQKLTACEVCAYLGHARNGGGPDFRPVPFEWANLDREPNYAYYLKNKTTYKRLLSALLERNTGDNPLIAILGCNSYKKFYSEEAAVCLSQKANCQKFSLKSFNSKASFVLTRALSWPQNRPRYLAALLEGVTGLKCRNSFIKSLQSVSNQPATPEAYELFGNYLGQ